jgi:O-acetyl-ADP-ribose deacetylase (regulator of RNase III)
VIQFCLMNKMENYINNLGKGGEKPKYTPDNIQELKDNEIIVFGSNKDGLHGGGLARVCYEKFGAEWGVGYGMTGKCFAINTMSGEKDIRKGLQDLIDTAKNKQDFTFYLTKIGTGIAGYTEDEIKEIVSEYHFPSNVIKPKDW